MYLVNLTNISPFTERSENFLEILSKKVLIRNSQNQDILVKAYTLLQHHHWLINLPSRPVKNSRRQDILVKIASNVRGFWWFVMFCWVDQKLEFIRWDWKNYLCIFTLLVAPYFDNFRSRNYKIRCPFYHFILQNFRF